MEINLMVLSLGNSRLAAGAFVAGELRGVTRLPHEQRDQWPARLAEVWGHVGGREDAAVAAASVNPPLDAALEAAVAGAAGRKVQWVGKDLDLPCKVLTDPPAETGVDRVLNVAAAHQQIGRACVVVDAGTALTVDCCDDQGDFLGGAIAPGVTMMLDALHERTARLPRVKFEVPRAVFGRSTAQAMLQGVYHGARGLVQTLVERYATELGRWPELIATGGDAPRLFEGWELVHAVAPDLTLYGIAHAYAEHHIKHET